MASDPMDKTTVLKMVLDGWETFTALLATFDDTEMVEPHPPDGWSVQDVMGHITLWENYVLDRLREAARGESPTTIAGLSYDELDDINHEGLAAGRARSLTDIKADFHHIHQELYTALEAIPDDQDAAWWGLWSDSGRVWRLSIHNTAEHYEEHGKQLRKWTKNL